MRLTRSGTGGTLRKISWYTRSSSGGVIRSHVLHSAVHEVSNDVLGVRWERHGVVCGATE